ncbi:MAG: methionyl-tRNA formyltransferase [Dehalococcoidales bacterium]|nr:methionyl-tRNA formyltransferase [Dehalococcoidales bacterium]
MKIVYMGTPWFSVPTLRRLADGGYEIAAVYTQPDRESGRGRSVSISPVKKAALEYEIPVEQPENFRDTAVVEKLASYRPEVVVVYSYGQILPQTVLDIAPLGCINVHPSLLPKYRGAAPVISAVLGGDAFTGVTIMKMARTLDTGDILMQSQVQVADTDTAGILTRKLSLVASLMIPDLLPRLERGQITPRQQNDSLATYCSQLSKKDGEIDWSLPAVDIWRRVRAYNPWPGSYTTWRGKQLKIDTARVLPGIDNASPGRIVALPDKKVLGIATGEGILGVTMLQLEGKKLMPAADFKQGHRDIEGELLPS